MLKKALKLFYHKHYRFKKVKILSRTACLGDEIIKKMGWSKNCINHQKSRVDYLLALASDSSISPKPEEIIKYLKNKFIIGTIEQQKKDFFGYKKPDIIIMDSFSELTDQMFIDTNSNRRFLANYGDIQHELLPNHYVCSGLIESDLYKVYDLFFKKISEVYKNTPLYFVHFSAILDTKEKFRDREKEIKNAILSCSKKYLFIKIIDIDGSEIEWSDEGDDEYKTLPYHYSKETYNLFTKKLKEEL